MKQSDFTLPPRAAIKETYFEKFGKIRTDPYYWLKDKTDTAVLDYLHAENAYTETVMAASKDLQQRIYEEITGRIKEDDESYPVFENGYYYYHRVEKGKQYKTYCRKKASLDAPEEIIFDVNQMAAGKQAFMFEEYIVSPDNTKAAYFYNDTGSFAEFTLKIRDLKTGKDIGFRYDGAASAAWANDCETLFYSAIDSTLRSSKIFRQKLYEPSGILVYEEQDAKYSAVVNETKTKDYIFITSSSATTSEEWFVPADTPEAPFQVFLPRVKDVEYFVYPHKEKFFIRWKDTQNLNGKIYSVPIASYADTATWQEERAHNEQERIEEICVFETHLVLELRKSGLIELEIKPLTGNDKDRESGIAAKKICFPEPVYTAYLGANPEYTSGTLRYGYTSLNRPTSLYSYDFKTGESVLLKQQEVPSGFNPEDYTVERLWAEAPDGVLVPMAVIYKKGIVKDGSSPALLYGYGSYGYSSEAYFSTSIYSLIERGFVYAVAQIRGGSEMGEQWYEDGKFLKKKNTFTDFIACAENLIKQKYTSSDKLAIMGGSAGGLLMGAVINMRPDLFHSVVAAVPFIDVVTTMLDDSLPLTTGEYEEWGNPHEEKYYDYMLSYSPYDNIAAKNYPHILITGGLNDSQVLFHEPAKYTAKLRANKTGDNLVLLRMDMKSGHGGATGRYDRIKDTAFEYAFILTMLGIYA
ncbi:MAG: S9 family peptidase [Treponema sp.]